MADLMLSEAERAQAGIMAALLSQGRALHNVCCGGLVVTLGLAALLAFAGRLDLVAGTLLACAVLAALAGTVTAVRVGFDARLFAALARGEFGLRAMDDTLVNLNLMPAIKAGRPLAPRIAGALRLMRVQAGMLALQGASLLAVLLLLMIRM